MALPLEKDLVLRGEAVPGLSIQIGSTVKWNLTCLNPKNGLAIDLTGKVVQMTLCAIDADGRPVQPPIISHQGDPVSPVAGKCKVDWPYGDTVPSGVPLPGGAYLLDAWVIEVSTGDRIADLTSSTMHLNPSATLPGTLITPLPPQLPLGVGPQGPPGPTGPPGPPAPGLLAAYLAAQSAANNAILLNAAAGGVRIRDNATPLGVALLEVSDSTASFPYLEVAAAGSFVQYRSGDNIFAGGAQTAVNPSGGEAFLSCVNDTDQTVARVSVSEDSTSTITSNISWVIGGFQAELKLLNASQMFFNPVFGQIGSPDNTAAVQVSNAGAHLFANGQNVSIAALTAGYLRTTGDIRPNGAGWKIGIPSEPYAAAHAGYFYSSSTYGSVKSGAFDTTADLIDYLRVTPAETNSVPWGHTFYQANINITTPRFDQISADGWNVGPGGNVIVANEAQVGVSVEAIYEPSPGVFQSEWHQFSNPNSGTGRRPLSILANRVTGAVQFYSDADSAILGRIVSPLTGTIAWSTAAGAASIKMASGDGTHSLYIDNDQWFFKSQNVVTLLSGGSANTYITTDFSPSSSKDLLVDSGIETARWRNVWTGAIQLFNANAKPAPSSAQRGKIFVEQGGGGARDVAYVCLKGDAGGYTWVQFADGGA